MSIEESWGIEPGYANAAGDWCAISERTRAAFLQAMGAGSESEMPSGPGPRIVQAGDGVDLQPGTLRLEDGGVLRVEGSLPPDVPLGYHTFVPCDGSEPQRFVLAPRCCYLPERLRAWGWAVQLYAVRSRDSWGSGDLEDLRRLAGWSAQLGAGALLVNPLHADTPVAPAAPSPYHPSSRLFKNPLYLRIEEIAGAADAGADLERLAARGRALNSQRRIDRDAVLDLKMRALELLWSRFGSHPEFERFQAEQGEALERFATFCVLAEKHGRDWHRWPHPFRRPENTAVHEFAAAHRERLRFHVWIQWLLDAQLARAGAGLVLMQDLPIGVDRCGADAWAWQDLLAGGVSVGAPPDPFSSEGQDWELPPFVPHRLRAAGYEPFVQTLRASLRHAGGLRVDHVMGLFRLFWIPEGGVPVAGGYVRYPAADLLALLALESQRARAFIVGEDLGTVEPQVRDELARRRVLSYRLLWFESGPPESFPELALSAVTTHDLPTIAGVWSGSEMRFARQNQRPSDENMLRGMHDLLRRTTGLPDAAAADLVIESTHRALGRARSAIVMATLDDALAVEERPNMPWSTANEWPNWSLALPQELEALESAALPRRLAAALARCPTDSGP